jgi:hypothetical protein
MPSVIWQGIQSQSGANLNYGVRAIQLERAETFTSPLSASRGGIRNAW